MSSEDSVTVADVMSTPLETVLSDATVRVAAERMREHDVNGLFVPGARPGIVTTTDLVDAVATGANPSDRQVADVMTVPVERVRASMELREAAEMMTTFDIKHLPVIDEHGDYVGMVSSTDVAANLV